MKVLGIGTWISAMSIALIVFSGCKQLDITPHLPDETREGKGTFGCKVNGELWLPYTDHTLDRAIEPEYQRGWFTVRAERELNVAEYIGLQLADTTGLHEKTYTFNDGFAAYFEDRSTSEYDNYHTDSAHHASLTITRIDTPANGVKYAIISGTFSFTAISSTTGRQVTITEGRFDLKAY